MSTSLWDRYPHLRRWQRLGPPARPNADVVAAAAALLGDRNGRVLLLGVTPEYADLGVQNFAVDHSVEMLAGMWPGNGPGRRAVRGDWLQLPFADGSVTAVVGDGSLGNLHYPDQYRELCREMQRVLRPGGRMVFRVYLTPSPCESLAGIAGLAGPGVRRGEPFHALVWRAAMALVAARGDPNITMSEMVRATEDILPGREVLVGELGFSDEEVAMLDHYRDSQVSLSYPTFAQLEAVLPRTMAITGLLPGGSYALADRCPLVAIDLRQ